MAAIALMGQAAVDPTADLWLQIEGVLEQKSIANYWSFEKGNQQQAPGARTWERIHSLQAAILHHHPKLSMLQSLRDRVQKVLEVTGNEEAQIERMGLGKPYEQANSWMKNWRAKEAFLSRLVTFLDFEITIEKDPDQNYFFCAP